jgi:hypothetical protein
MRPDNFWQDPRTWAAVGGVALACISFIYSMISNYWNRHESRLDAISKILQPMIRAAQHFNKANNARQKCEQLRISFPNAQAAQEAQLRLDSLFAVYNESIKDAEKEFRIAESELAARKFRFPDKISHLTSNALVTIP